MARKLGFFRMGSTKTRFTGALSEHKGRGASATDRFARVTGVLALAFSAASLLLQWYSAETERFTVRCSSDTTAPAKLSSTSAGTIELSIPWRCEIANSGDRTISISSFDRLGRMLEPRTVPLPIQDADGPVPATLPFRLEAGVSKAVLFYQTVELDQAQSDRFRRLFLKAATLTIKAMTDALERECVIVGRFAGPQLPEHDFKLGLWWSPSGPYASPITIEVSSARGTRRQHVFSAGIQPLEGEDCRELREFNTL